MKSTNKKKKPLRPLLQLEILESRVTPVVGPLTNAPPTTDPLFDGVVEINTQDGALGSGALLLNNTHILTATHVVTNDSGLTGSGTVIFHLATGSKINIPYSASDVTLLPGYVASFNDVSPNDVALIRLPQAPPVGVTGYDLYRKNDEMGKDFTLVGFGNTGTGVTGQQDGTTGIKRIGVNTFDMTTNVDSGQQFFRNLSTDFDNGSSSGNTIQSEFQISSSQGVFNGGILIECDSASGDSGGPAFIQTPSGLQIAGIVNFGGTGNNGTQASFGGLSSYARVSSFSRAIDEAVGATLSPRIATPIFAVAPGSTSVATSTPTVEIYDAANTLTTQPVEIILAYPEGFTGGVRLAMGDVNGDGFVDIVTGPGPGGGPHIKVFSGVDFSLMREFFAFEPEFTGGVYLGAGDVNGDGFDDLIVGAGEGGGPRVQVFSGANFTVLKDFFAYAPEFRGGVRVAAGLIDNDSLYDLIIAAGPGGGPHVKVYSSLSDSPFLSFFAYAASFTGGVYLAAGNLSNTGFDLVVTGAGEGGGPNVRSFDNQGNVAANFFAFSPEFTGGARVATGLMSPTTQNGDFIAVAGPGGGPIAVTDNAFGNPLGIAFFPFSLDFSGGLFAAGRS